MAISGLTSAMGSCFSEILEFPDPLHPGLPNFALGTFLGTFAGVSFVLNFIPPSPTNLPSLPNIDLFLKPFLGAMKVPGLTLPAPPGFSPLGAFNLVFATVQLIFKLFTNIILGILNLTIDLPTPGNALKLFLKITADLGFSPDIKLQCIPLGIVKMITSLI